MAPKLALSGVAVAALLSVLAYDRHSHEQQVVSSIECAPLSDYASCSALLAQSMHSSAPGSASSRLAMIGSWHATQ